MASVQRQPFGELGASRLQGLTSQKNCQNAISDALTNIAKPSLFKQPHAPTQMKRPFTPADDDSDGDTENQDPSLYASKGSKGSNGTPSKKLKLNVVPHSLSTSTLNKPATPISPLFDKSMITPNAFSVNTTSGANSAPAGRSPKHKRVGLLGKKRSSMSPFKRVNPPTFASSSRGGLPFSIDAALNGTFSSSRPTKPNPTPTAAPTSTPFAKPVAPAKAATIEESMPSGWFFDIHEDTPEEEASNLMEHSTGILDISSDDEASPRKKDDRGKENIPPADEAFGNSNGTEGAQVAGGKLSRRQDPDAMKDVGEERSPLDPLNAEEFYGKGLDATSVEVVKPDAEHDVECKEQVEPPATSATVPLASSDGQALAQDEHDHPRELGEASAKPFDAISHSLDHEAEEGGERDATSAFEIAVDNDCAEA